MHLRSSLTHRLALPQPLPRLPLSQTTRKCQESGLWPKSDPSLRPNITQLRTQWELHQVRELQLIHLALKSKQFTVYWPSHLSSAPSSALEATEIVWLTARTS